MADKNMPMLLDNGLTMPMEGVDDVVAGVDDLFGDTTALSMPQTSKQIDLRIDRLRTRGCCRLAISKRSHTRQYADSLSGPLPGRRLAPLRPSLLMAWNYNLASYDLSLRTAIGISRTR